jgi:hypothetical protein
MNEMNSEVMYIKNTLLIQKLTQYLYLAYAREVDSAFHGSCNTNCLFSLCFFLHYFVFVCISKLVLKL